MEAGEAQRLKDLYEAEKRMQTELSNMSIKQSQDRFDEIERYENALYDLNREYLNKKYNDADASTDENLQKKEKKLSELMTKNAN